MPDGRYLVRESHRETLWERVDRLKRTLPASTAAFILASATSLALIVGSACVAVWTGYMYLHGQVVEGFAAHWLHGVVLIYAGVLVGGATLASLWACWAWVRSEKWLLSRLGAIPVPQGRLMDTKMALKDMAIAGGLPVAPELFVLDTTNVNAFVFQARGRRPVLGVTRGLLERMPLDERRAVFANLVARLISGDARKAAALASLIGPISAWRDRSLDGDLDELSYVQDTEWVAGQPSSLGESIAGVAPLFVVFGVGLIVASEFIAAGYRGAQLRTAEKADAEGMLLLKEPHAMLAALERCVVTDNFVPGAESGLGDLFFCWTGSESTDDADDPEWRRVSRLREVLGVEGADLRERLSDSVDATEHAPQPRWEQVAP